MHYFRDNYPGVIFIRNDPNKEYISAFLATERALTFYNASRVLSAFFHSINSILLILVVVHYQTAAKKMADSISGRLKIFNCFCSIKLVV